MQAITVTNPFASAILAARNATDAADDCRSRLLSLRWRLVIPWTVTDDVIATLTMANSTRSHDLAHSGDRLLLL
jgi:hypothetical protein